MKKDGGPAFPQPNHIVEHDTHGRVEARQWMQDSGMSLRDYFAANALVGILSTPIQQGCTLTLFEAARHAYDYADAMVAARNA